MPFRGVARGVSRAFHVDPMRVLQVMALSTMFACALEHETPEHEQMLPPDVNVSTPAVDDVRCAGAPDAGPATTWRHLSSEYIVDLGSPYHRGHDLIVTTEDATQTITGKITYGPSDKDLEDEDVDVFACMAKGWLRIGTARTNGDGQFSLALSGDERLPAGMRDLYVSVAGDRTGAKFLALVAPPDAPVIASDVDGTLTASENAYPKALAFGGDVATQPDAPATLMSAAVRGVTIVYITARGDRFTQDTRDWFAAKGFPRGPLRMPTSIVTQPGEDTVEFKTSALAALAPFELVAGFGNRASDIAAYANAGLSPDRIFIKLPEFEDELAADLAAGKATGVLAYDALRTNELAALLEN